jgi:hypothetical protein
MAPVPSTFNIPYSQKNIPTIPKFQYQKMLVGRMEQFLTSMRWKLFWFKAPTQQKEKKNTYGFKSTTKPPAQPEIKKFEEELIKIVSNIEMKPFNNSLQTKMKEDMRSIKEMEEVIVSSDKTSNFYLIPRSQYKDLQAKTIQKEYKRVGEEKVEKINAEAAKIAADLELDNRIEALALKPSYLTLKDHKSDWPGKVHCRLINPTKTNLGKISKSILDRVNGEVRKATGFKQFKNTKQVLDWFNNLPEKKTLRWLKFDVTAFYPSITMELLNKSIQYAKTLTHLTDTEEKIIFHCRKNILMGPDGTTWQKVSNPDFDVSMGVIDGAEVCECTGLYLLKRLEEVMNKEQMGLYRDDGICVIKGGGPEVEKTKKKIHKIFQEERLSITMEGNTTSVDFLDVVMDLSSGTHKPYIKPNANTRYVSQMSSHPPAILRSIPESVSKRLSVISSGVEQFDQEVRHYQTAMEESGYTDQLTFLNNIQPVVEERSKKRHRNVLWFNPPWSSNVRTNVAGKFLGLIRKHFPPSSPLYSIFNTKKIKVSYSTCPNIKAYIASHNAKVIKGGEDNAQTHGCNCNKGEASCPLQGDCQVPALVYKAEVESSSGNKHYFGQTAITFKKRWNNHKSDCKLPHKRLATTFSNHMWSLKDMGEESSVSWSKVSVTKPYERGGKTCSLCLTEKVSIARDLSGSMLNKRREIMNRCRHRDKHYLTNFLSVHDPGPVQHQQVQHLQQQAHPPLAPPQLSLTTPVQQFQQQPVPSSPAATPPRLDAEEPRRSGLRRKPKVDYSNCFDD